MEAFSKRFAEVHAGIDAEVMPRHFRTRSRYTPKSQGFKWRQLGTGKRQRTGCFLVLGGLPTPGWVLAVLVKIHRSGVNPSDVAKSHKPTNGDLIVPHSDGGELF
jgi:hypothetical protein